MLFRQLFDAQSSSYSYLIADTNLNIALLVDPILEQLDRDLRLLQELNLSLKYCLETHIHADHITSANALRLATGCTNVVPKIANVECADYSIQANDHIQLGSILIQAIATPGHTNCHMSYLINQSHILTGDALLIRGCGRTDFQGGNAGDLFDSVTEKLFTLPPNIAVYPAHDYAGHTSSTIAEERAFNPRFINRTREAFIAYMQALDLPMPAKIMAAVPANRSCGNVMADY